VATLATFRLAPRGEERPTPNRIAEIRQARGMSQDDLATRIGCTKSQLSRLENGQRRLTRPWQGRLAAALDVAPEDLLGEPALFSLRTGSRPAETPPAERGGVEDPMPPAERTLPLCGLGQWGLPDGVGVFVDPARAPERVWCPAPLARVRGAYAVRMPDGSLWPKYGPNQLLFVHPFRAPQPGAPVVVRGDGRFLVAVFVGAGPTTIRLERYRPAQQFEVERGDVEAVECILVSEER
jgi:transcriptional regulator with XRE-family HTH domain